MPALCTFHLCITKRVKLCIPNIVFLDSIKERIPAVEAEKILRIALFSDTLKLSHTEDKMSPDDMTPSIMASSSRLVLKRQALAQLLRENRKKGVVPVFVSLMWFLFSLAISIQASFGDLGNNQTAHDLALGLLLGWRGCFSSLAPLFIVFQVARHVSKRICAKKCLATQNFLRSGRADPRFLGSASHDTCHYSRPQPYGD